MTEYTNKGRYKSINIQALKKNVGTSLQETWGTLNNQIHTY